MLPSMAVFAGSLAFCLWGLAGSLPRRAALPPASAHRLEFGEAASLEVALPGPANPAWARPLFFSSRAPRVADLSPDGGGEAAAPPAFEVRLTGIVRAARTGLVTLAPPAGGRQVRVKLGQEVPGYPGWRLVHLAGRSATFRSGDDSRVVKIDPRAALPAPVAMVGAGGSLPLAGAAASTAGQGAPSGAGPMRQPDQVEEVRRRIEAARRHMSRMSEQARKR
ncbi:hypothetical protein EBB59_04095 [Lysobacter pythonis]|uniref:General secretion pathway protein GspN n=2 Tax=Solilutibacter pythonis TaxID=2483112 RepID=A0A3M2HVR1_9GAMM|nr:hypothetical protein EBB59_04095 [Lysobacter pythonis]